MQMSKFTWIPRISLPFTHLQYLQVQLSDNSLLCVYLLSSFCENETAMYIYVIQDLCAFTTQYIHSITPICHQICFALGNVGTVHWTAPEVLSSQRYQFPADIYGLGMILFEMISGKIPFHNLIPVAVMMAVAINKQQPEMPEDCNPHLAAIIKRYM